MLLAAVFALAELARWEGIDPQVVVSLRDVSGYLCMCRTDSMKLLAVDSLATIYSDHARTLAAHGDRDAWVYEAAAAVLRTARGGTS